MIAIIDYNMGNLQSVINACEKLGTTARLESDPEKLKDYDRAILPGVGAFADAMEHLHVNGMSEAVKEYARSGKPLFGICLGMQVLFDKSTEFGETKGLGLIPGEVIEFDTSKFEKKLKVPHMGWNELFIQKESPLFKGLSKEFYLYFVHSYHAVTKEEFTIGKSLYGYEFVSAVQKDNIFGLQPHPEKSHENGLQVLKNFVEL